MSAWVPKILQHLLPSKLFKKSGAAGAAMPVQTGAVPAAPAALAVPAAAMGARVFAETGKGASGAGAGSEAVVAVAVPPELKVQLTVETGSVQGQVPCGDGGQRGNYTGGAQYAEDQFGGQGNFSGNAQQGAAQLFTGASASPAGRAHWDQPSVLEAGALGVCVPQSADRVGAPSLGTDGAYGQDQSQNRRDLASVTTAAQGPNAVFRQGMGGVCTTDRLSGHGTNAGAFSVGSANFAGSSFSSCSPFAAAAYDHDCLQPQFGSQVRFAMGHEIMRVTTQGAYVFPVKSVAELLQENAGKIALIYRYLDATPQEIKVLVTPLITACAKLCLMLPASNVHHDAFTGGLFSHNLSVVLSALDWVKQLIGAESASSTHGLTTSSCLQEQLNKELKLELERSQDLTNQLLKAEDVSVDDGGTFYDYSCLNLSSKAAMLYREQNFQALKNFDQRFMSSVPPSVRQLWRSFIPTKVGKGPAVNESLVQGQGADATTEQVMLLRHHRVKLAETLLPTPSFTVNDFESLEAWQPSECKSALECLANQELYLRNYFVERRFEFLAGLGLVAKLDPEAEELAKMRCIAYEQDPNQVLVKRSICKQIAPSIERAEAELSLAHPYLSQYQRGFCLELACIFLALIHDLGKLITDMQIFAASGARFAPSCENLEHFVLRQQTPVLYVYYEPQHAQLHQNCLLQSSLMLAQECPAAFDFLAHFFSWDRVLQSENSPLLKVVNMADRWAASYTMQDSFTPNIMATLLVEQVVRAYRKTLAWQHEQMVHASIIKLHHQQQAQQQMLQQVQQFSMPELTASTTGFVPQGALIWQIPVPQPQHVQWPPAALRQLSSDMPYAEFAAAGLAETFTETYPSQTASPFKQQLFADSPFFFQRWAPATCLATGEITYHPLGRWSQYSMSGQNPYGAAFKPRLHYFGQLPLEGACRLSMHDWIEQRQCLNNPYSEIFVMPERMLIVGRSMAYARLSMQVQELELGPLSGQNVLSNRRLVCHDLIKSGGSASVLTHRGTSWFKVRCGDDLILCNGTDFSLSSYEISAPLTPVEFNVCSASDPMLQKLLKGLVYACQEINKSYQDCKNYAQQDDHEILKMRVGTCGAAPPQQSQPKSRKRHLAAKTTAQTAEPLDPSG